MANKVAIVTGSNKGIGFAIVRALCKKFDGDVILTSRDKGRGQEAVKILQEEGLKPIYHQLDITSNESIENLKTFLVQKYGGLDILVNNAGIAYKSASTAPFIEQVTVTMATNFTATMNISKAMFPILRPHSRVVNISSSGGVLSRVQPNIQEKFADPNLTEAKLLALMDEYIRDVTAGDYKEKGWTNTGSGTTKMAVNSLTRIHAQDMTVSGKEDILVNCCCPGWVKTDMAGPSAPLTPDQGAETPTMLALLPPGSPTGKFWKDLKIAQW